MNARGRLRVLWHRARGHHVRDLGRPCGEHRVWCYRCAADLLPWKGYPSLEELLVLEQAKDGAR